MQACPCIAGGGKAGVGETSLCWARRCYKSPQLPTLKRGQLRRDLLRVGRFSAGLVRVLCAPPQTLHTPHSSPVHFSCGFAAAAVNHWEKQTHAHIHTPKQRHSVVGLCSTDEETSGPETPLTVARISALTATETEIQPRRTAFWDSDVSNAQRDEFGAFATRLWNHFPFYHTPSRLVYANAADSRSTGNRSNAARHKS